MSDSYRVSKLTDCRWANLFEVDYAQETATETLDNVFEK